LRWRRLRIELAIIRGERAARIPRRNAQRGGCLLRKCAAGQVVAAGSPGGGFLFGAGMDGDEKSLQIEDGALEFRPRDAARTAA